MNFLVVSLCSYKSNINIWDFNRHYIPWKSFSFHFIVKLNPLRTIDLKFKWVESFFYLFKILIQSQIIHNDKEIINTGHSLLHFINNLFKLSCILLISFCWLFFKHSEFIFKDRLSFIMFKLSLGLLTWSLFKDLILIFHIFIIFHRFN